MELTFGHRSQTRYDLPTAITFLMAGLGIGSLLAVLFAPRKSTDAPSGMRPASRTASAV